MCLAVGVFILVLLCFLSLIQFREKRRRWDEKKKGLNFKCEPTEEKELSPSVSEAQSEFLIMDLVNQERFRGLKPSKTGMHSKTEERIWRGKNFAFNFSWNYIAHVSIRWSATTQKSANIFKRNYKKVGSKKFAYIFLSYDNFKWNYIELN